MGLSTIDCEPNPPEPAPSAPAPPSCLHAPTPRPTTLSKGRYTYLPDPKLGETMQIAILICRVGLRMFSASVARVAVARGGICQASSVGSSTCLFMARVQFAPDINDAFTAEAEPQEAIGIAAYNGSNDALAEIFSKNPSLVTATDGAGRTALHWAVAGSQAMTVKYLLGRWSCADLIHAEDRQGSTPLMLYRGP